MLPWEKVGCWIGGAGMVEKVKLPVGIDDFKRLREQAGADELQVALGR